ncbi:MAG: cysteine hydrolase [Clostridia bacterium]|nr:cysteine hydrolase [Clostridia bacterium]
MKKILIVVDYQNDFVDGSLGFAGAELLDGVICSRIEQTLAEGGELVFTYDTHGEDYPNTHEGRSLPVTHCQRGSHGWALYGKTADYLDRAARCFEKPTFGSLELAQYLCDGGYEEIELCGLVSNICVVSNVLLARAACPDARIVVHANATGSADPAAHEAALTVMRSVFVEVVEG